MNPADAFRKTQRAKEIARNKKERKFQRDAHSMKDNPEAIKEELKSVLDAEEGQDGRVNQTIRLKKRALQGAYDTALKKRKVCCPNPNQLHMSPKEIKCSPSQCCGRHAPS